MGHARFKVPVMSAYICICCLEGIHFSVNVISRCEVQIFSCWCLFNFPVAYISRSAELRIL